MSDRYWRVRVGRLGKYTGPSEQPFPNRKAALRFAEGTHGMYPNVVIVVKDPQRRIVKRYNVKPLKSAG